MTQKVIKFESLDSTNNYVAKGLETGQYKANDVILAGFQTEGRGQRGNIWQSEFDKNLTFSFGFRSDFLNLDDQFIISKAISVAIAKYLENKIDKQVILKWPNDVLIRNQKICGILLETKLVERKRYMVVGIGLNLNQTSFNTDYAVTSMCLELGKALDVDSELSDLLNCIGTEIDLLKTGEIVKIEESYLSRLLGTNNYVLLKRNDVIFKGKIVDVKNNSEITVKKLDGSLNTFRAGDVRISY